MAKDYKQLLTRMYSMYRPEKVADVDRLLKDFAGREEELIHKIYMKYGGPEASRDAKRKLDLHFEKKKAGSELAPVVSGTPDAPRRRRPYRGVVAVIIALSLVAGLSYAGWRIVQGEWDLLPVFSHQPSAEPAPDPMFVLADAVAARDNCEAGEKTPAVKRYGDTLTNYAVIGTCLLDHADTSAGPRYYPAEYFLTEDKFREIDAIFGNEEARKQINNSFEKKALRNWFRTNGITGNLSQKWKQAIVPEGKNPGVWQIFAESEGSQLNAWARGNFRATYPDDFPGPPRDLAVIITKASAPEQRKLLFFSFNKEGVSEIHEAFDLGKYPGMHIREFPRDGDDWSRFFYNERYAPAHQGILLEDPSNGKPDFVLLWKSDHFAVQEEIPRDTFHIPGLPPIIM